MTLPIILRPEAHDDVIAARNWYAERQTALGNEFVAALDELFSKIAHAPEMHELVIRDVRRGILRRFPYVAYYRVHSDQIEVVAVLHGRRAPSIWKRRSEPS